MKTKKNNRNSNISTSSEDEENPSVSTLSSEDTIKKFDLKFIYSQPSFFIETGFVK